MLPNLINSSNFKPFICINVQQIYYKQDYCKLRILYFSFLNSETSVEFFSVIEFHMTAQEPVLFPLTPSRGMEAPVGIIKQEE